MQRLYNENAPDNDEEYTPYEETLQELYEHLFELEDNKPVGDCPSWNKKYKYYKEKIKEYHG